MSNDMTKPCEVWTKAIANPKDANAVSELRARLTEILEHVRECDACRAAGDERAGDAAALFEALGVLDAELTPEQRAEIEAIEQAWSDNERQIDKAVKEILLNAVGMPLPRFETTVRPLDVFLATNAVNLLVFNRVNPKKQQLFVLTREGLMEDGPLVVSDALLCRQIRRHAPIADAAAKELYRWSLKAAEYVPGLFMQFQAESTWRGIELKLDSPALKQDLFTRWLPKVKTIEPEAPTRPGAPKYVRPSDIVTPRARPSSRPAHTLSAAARPTRKLGGTFAGFSAHAADGPAKPPRRPARHLKR